jgi:hypothetical protein
MLRLKIILIVSYVFLKSFSAGAQVQMYRDTIVKVSNSLGVMPNAWACGFNSPIFAEMDLNGDGTMDLISFDIQSYRLSCFINTGVVGASSYVYAPEYVQYFTMPLEGWIKTFDYDFDGDMDFFVYRGGGIAVYRNDFSIGMGLSFSIASNQLQTDYGSISSNLYSSRVDAPALVDIDSDGDMDILSFYIGGSWIELNKNFAMDSLGNPNQFLFYNIYGCWGYFYKDANSNKAILPPVPNMCPLIPADPWRLGNANQTQTRDGGSFLWAADLDGDGDKDLLCGDKVARNMLYVQNCGTPDSAWACSEDSLYPSYNVPSSMRDISAPQYFDVDNDGNKDLLSTNFNSLGEDLNNILFYKNTTNNSTNQFAFQSKRFLSDQMIEVGTSAHPVFFDYDNDGKKDLLISNDFYFDNGNQVSRVAFYKNTSVGNATNFTWITDSIINFRSTGLIGTMLTFGDLDGDNDSDLLVGDADGRLSLFINIAATGLPANFVFSVGYFQSIDVGNDAAPFLVDVNRDGKLDLIIGERFGNLNYYRNSGTTASPVFTLETITFGNVDVRNGGNAGYSRPVLLDNGNGYELFVGSYSGSIYHYNNIDGNLAGSFTLLDSTFQSINEKIKATISIADIDTDGKYDLIVGNQAGGVVLYTQNALLSSVLQSPLRTSNLFLYPNPASNVLHLDFNLHDTNNNFSYKIMDLSGRTFANGNLKNHNNLVEISDLKSGFYLLQVFNANYSRTEKFIKL